VINSLEVVGAVDVMTAADLRARLFELLERGGVWLDLSRAERIDMTGLAAVMAGISAARRTGHELRIAWPLDDRVGRLLEVAGVHDVCSVVS
jgi:anti-anti-sigma factor